VEVASQQPSQAHPMRSVKLHGSERPCAHVAPAHGLAQDAEVVTVGVERTVAPSTPFEASAVLSVCADWRIPEARELLAVSAAASLGTLMVASTRTEAAEMVTVTSDGRTPAPEAMVAAIEATSDVP